MSEISSGKTWDRAKLIQTFASGAAGLLVAADVMSLRVPLYFFGQATDRVGDVFHTTARLVRDDLPALFEKLGTGAVTVSDALYLASTVVLVGAGFVFLRRTCRALAVMRPGQWLGVPHLGWRGKLLAVLALGGAIALVWQYDDLPGLARRLVHSLWLAIKAAYTNSDEVWQAVLAIYGSREIIGQVAKGVLGAVATYVTVEVARVTVDFALSIIRFVLPIMSPVARHGYRYARQWLPNVELTPGTIDWLHGTGSLAAGSILGFENLSFPSLPSWLWVASVPGFLVFSSTRAAARGGAGYCQLFDPKPHTRDWPKRPRSDHSPSPGSHWPCERSTAQPLARAVACRGLAGPSSHRTCGRQACDTSPGWCPASLQLRPREGLAAQAMNDLAEHGSLGVRELQSPLQLGLQDADFGGQIFVPRQQLLVHRPGDVGPEQLNGVFFTHMHNDHTEGFADLMQLRWSFYSTGPKIDAICSTDIVSPLGFTMSCRKFAAHIADAFIQSGEIAQRHSEVKDRTAGGPADLINTITFEPKDEPQVVWSSGDVRVNAIQSTHIAGHVSYRVDTPAGSVVIGGDAGNDLLAPPRASSTSDQVEKLAKGADIIVHSTIHPIMGPDKGSGFFPYAYYRQSSASDLGAMAKRAGAKHLMLTHLIPPIGADRQGPFKIPGGPLTEADYRKAAQDGGFTGNTIVGTDLASLRLPAK
jgi:ribonuclease Z